MSTLPVLTNLLQLVIRDGNLIARRGWAGLFWVETFFFFCQKTRLFFKQVESQNIIFGQSESKFSFGGSHINHLKSSIHAC